MSFLARLFGKPQQSDDPCDRIETFVSEHGPRHRMRPALAFGHEAKSFAKETAKSSTMSVFVVPDLDTLAHVIDCADWKESGVEFRTLFARSRANHPGEAGDAIRLFREKKTRVKTFYGAWDYDAEKAARRATEYHADGILMPGMDANEMYRYIFAIISRDDPPPTTPEQHVELLRQFATKELSPFWRNAARVRSEMY